MAIEATHVKRYYNTLLLMMKLSKAERIFLDFLTEEMDDQNFVSNTILLRAKFNSLLKKIGQSEYSDSTIHRCFSNLTKYEILQKSEGRGAYQVSPIFFFNGSEEQRVKVLRDQLELINKEQINAYRRGELIRKASSSTRARGGR